MNSLRIHYFLTDFISGIILICLPIYFKVAVQLSAFEVGIIYLVGGIISVICALISSIIAQKIKIKKRILNLGLIFMISGIIYFNILLIITGSITFNQALIGSSLIFSMRSLLHILGDELTITYTKINKKANYGKIRSFGSLGWGANFLIMGIVLIFLTKWFMTIFLLSGLFIWFNSFYLPTNQTKEQLEFKFQDLKKILRMPNFLVYLVINTLLLSVLNNMNIFVEYTIIDNGDNLSWYYILSIIFITVDMLTVHYSSTILKKLKPRKYLLTFILLLNLKLIILILFAKTILLYIVILLDAIIWGLFIPFTSSFINSETSSNLLTILFMLAYSCALIFTSIFSPIFGYLYDKLGSSATFISMFILISIALILAQKLNLKNIKN